MSDDRPYLTTTEIYKIDMRWCLVCRGSIFGFDDHMECPKADGMVHEACWKKYTENKDPNFRRIYSEKRGASPVCPKVVKHRC